MNTNSSTRMLPQPYHKNVNLKVLYTFDDKNTFLARSDNPILAKIITLPNQSPHNGMEIGCIDLKDCLNLLQSSSPEYFQKGMDYSIYYKDIIEIDEPYVGSGLFSKLSKNVKSTALITGRLCTNFISLYQGSSADTLDVKLRLSPIHNSNNRNNVNGTHHTTGTKRKQLDAFPLYTDNMSSPYSTIEEIQTQQQQQRKKIRKSSIHSIKMESTNTTNNYSSKNNLPQLASRTQSLPFITEDSLAHRIRISDMIKSKVDEEVDVSGERISSRFANFSKTNKNDDDTSSQPTRARKSKSFIQSVVKIGDNTINSKTKKTSLASVNEHSLKKCVNCMTSSAPPYKFHKDGLFQHGNSGYLCSVCNFYQKADTKALRERGEMGVNGLLDDPYINTNPIINKVANSTANTAKRTRRKPRSKASGNNLSSNPNSSVIEDVSSSPPLSSSPMNLQNGFTSKSQKNFLSSSNFANNINAKRGKVNNRKNTNIIDGINSTSVPLDNIGNLKHDDLMALLKLDSTFSNYKQPIPPTELDPIEDIFRIPGPPSTGSSGHSSKPQSKNNTPNENGDEYYKDFDNIPMDATKLNTTLIPLDVDIDIDEEDKENMPPLNIDTGKLNTNNNDHIHNLFGTTDISPSIQRIIESFSNEPSSPTKTTGNEWNYNFFEQDDDEDAVNCRNNDNQFTERDDEDPEINRILSNGNVNVNVNVNENDNIGKDNKANITINNLNTNDKYEITPRDPGTTQTQQNGDSPNGVKTTTPVNTNTFDLNISSVDKSAKMVSTNASTKTIIDATGNGDKNKDKKDSNNSSKKSRLTMPSSPFFHMQVPQNEESKDDKTIDTTESLINWDAKSSPVTDPMSSVYEKV